MKKAFYISFLAFIMTSLCACGKKGDPIHPPTSQDIFPGKYPKDYE